MSKITESTLIPLGASLVVLAAVSSAILWMAAVASATSSNAESIRSVEGRVGKVEEKIVNQNEIVIKDLSRIKERLGIDN